MSVLTKVFSHRNVGRKALDEVCQSYSPEIRNWWLMARDLLGEELAQDLRQVPGYQRLNILPTSFLFSNDLDGFAAEFKGGIAEVIKQPLYGIEAYGTAGHTQLVLFKPATSRGLAFSNLLAPGQMNGGEAHVVLAIRLIPLPVKADVYTSGAIAPAAAEWYDILTGGTTGCWLDFWIQEKKYATVAPLIGCPAGMGIASGGQTSTATTSVNSISVVNNGHPSNMALYKTDPPVMILPNRHFRVELNWPTAKTVTSIGAMGVWLDGYRIRAMQ